MYSEMKKPQYLIVVDEDTMTGIEKGYYESMSKRSNQLEIGDVQQIEQRWGRGVLAKMLPFDDVALYVLNRYNGKYYPVNDKDLPGELVRQKGIFYKGALKMLGAKKIMLSSETVELVQKEKQAGGSVSGGTPVYSLDASMDYESKEKNRNYVKQILTFEDENNTPASVEEIEAYIQKHGLENESDLIQRLDSLRRKPLSGKETITVEFCSEFDDFVKCGAKLIGKNKLFSADIQGYLNTHQSKTFKFEENLEVEF